MSSKRLSDTTARREAAPSPMAAPWLLAPAFAVPQQARRAKRAYSWDLVPTSRHARGRQKPKNWKRKLKRRRKMAKASRRRNRT